MKTHIRVIIFLLSLIFNVKTSESNEASQAFLKNEIISVDKSVDYQQVKSIKAHFSFIQFIYPLKSGNFVTVSKDLTLKEWNPRENFDLTHTIYVKEKDHLITSMIELDNGYLAVAAFQRIRIYDTNNNYELIKTIDAHSLLIESIIRLKNGYVVSSSDDQKVKIWDPKNDFSLIQTLDEHSASVHQIIEMSNGFLVSASYDKTIKFWSNIGNEYRLVKSVNAMAFSMTEVNGFLAYGTNSSLNFDIILMDVNDFSVKGSYKGHTKGVVFLKLLKSGYLASASRDATLKIWNAESFEELNTLRIHGQEIFKFAELDDGRLVTGGYQEFQVWTSAKYIEYEY